jgi:hypothetical protein
VVVVAAVEEAIAVMAPSLRPSRTEPAVVEAEVDARG